MRADFLKSLFVTFGDAIFVGDSAFGGSDFELSGVLDFDDEDSLFLSLLTHIFDGDGDFISDDERLTSDFTGDPSLLFDNAKLNLSDF